MIEIAVFVVATTFAATLFLMYFNRNPEREIPKGNVIVSPADGKIIAMRKEDNWEKIAIFMNLHDVHVQRIPLSGKVVLVQHVEGGNLPANVAEATHNKQVVTAIQTEIGEIKVKQATGFLVRRIQTFVKANDEVVTGQRLGRIMFGSLVELWLPKGTKIEVSVGQRVLAGKDIVARI